MKESASTTFRRRLRELRETLRWTQNRAAKACGIGQKLYQLYETGVKKNPELFTLQKIATGFGLEIHELLSPSWARFRRHPSVPRTKRRHKSSRLKKRRN